MKDSIEILRPKMLRNLAHGNPDIFLGEDFAVLYRISGSLAVLKEKMMAVPQYIEVGRLIRITAGTAKFRINLLPVELEAGNVLIVPENCYIEISELSADFNVQIVSFKELPISFPRFAHLRLNEVDFHRTGDYIDLIWNVIHKPSISMQTVSFLLAALMNDLLHIYQQVEQGKRILTRSEKLMQEFVDLVAEHGAKERNVSFYAEKLLLTPNYLSAFIRKHSNKSVMQWLNERTLLQAKALLKHTNQSISEIAFLLNFAEVTLFSRFFKRETGMTPKEFRNLRLL